MKKLKPVLLFCFASLAVLSACNTKNESQNKKAIDAETQHHENHKKSRVTQVKITPDQEVIEANKITTATISITENDTIVPLEEVHEMKLHLLVVNEELTWFSHLHPEEQPNGTYTFSETFPTAGNYLLFTDYKPIHGESAVNMQKLEVKGTPVTPKTELKTKLISTVDDFTVTLLNGTNLKTNTNQSLQFSVEKNGKQLLEKDMQNYLGATAHIVMISKADKDFLHIHPNSDTRFPINASTHIEKAGLYRMWVQFKVDNKVHTADFTVTVSEGEMNQHGHDKHHH